MKQLIIYNSKTGFTEKYAKWLSEEMGFDIISLKEIKKVNLSDYKGFIFATSVFAGKLKKLEVITRYNFPNLTLLSVGFTDMESEYEKNLKEQNAFYGNLFYVQGGINYEKLGFFAKKLVKMVTKQPNSIDASKREYLSKIEDFLKE